MNDCRIKEAKSPRVRCWNRRLGNARCLCRVCPIRCASKNPAVATKSCQLAWPRGFDPTFDKRMTAMSDRTARHLIENNQLTTMQGSCIILSKPTWSRWLFVPTWFDAHWACQWRTRRNAINYWFFSCTLKLAESVGTQKLRCQLKVIQRYFQYATVVIKTQDSCRLCATYYTWGQICSHVQTVFDIRSTGFHQ
jgi:hypothetical protein